MSGRNFPAALFFLALALQALFALRAMAFEKSGLLDGIEYRFICTDVAQLKEKINVLVILSRAAGEGEGKKVVRVALGIPTGAFEPSAGPESLEAVFELGPPANVDADTLFEGLLHCSLLGSWKFICTGLAYNSESRQ